MKLECCSPRCQKNKKRYATIKKEQDRYNIQRFKKKKIGVQKRAYVQKNIKHFQNNTFGQSAVHKQIT